MRRIAELAGCQLEWVQPNAMKMNYELWADGQRAATLRFRSAFGSFATGESGDGCWTFKRMGFFQTRATVRACAQEADLALFRNNTWKSGGTLELPDGRRIRATTNFWQTRYEFIDENDEPLVRYQLHGMFHMSAVVEILPAGQDLPELPWLVILGWYLAIMMHQDAAAAAAA